MTAQKAHPAPLERCLVLAQVACRLSRSEAEVRRIRATDPTFPRAFRLRPGGDPVYDLAELDAWIDARKEASAVEDGETPDVRAPVARLISEGAGLASSGRAPVGGRRGRGACTPRSAAP